MTLQEVYGDGSKVPRLIPETIVNTITGVLAPRYGRFYDLLSFSTYVDMILVRVKFARVHMYESLIYY